jgi:CelD/BcsL family acetyltransferase involved in cellulose biosynthesis
MKITVIHPSELGECELTRWRALQQTAASFANPFLSPEFTLAVGRVRSQARVAILSDGPQIVGFFPFERRGIGYGVPIAAGLNDCQGLVHMPGLEWDPQELLRACKLAVWEFDHLLDGQKPFEPYQVLRAPSPVMDLTAGYEAYLTQLHHNSAKPPGAGPVKQSIRELPAKERKLARQVGEPHFVLDSRNHEALHTLMAWKSAQYQRTGIPDRFARPWIVQLLEQLLDTHTENFAGVLAMLYAGDEPVAGHFLLRSKHMMAAWFPAYDTRFRKYSPGLITRLHTAQTAATAGIHYIDLGRGAMDYKDLFKSWDLYVAEGQIVRRSPAAAFHQACRIPAYRLRHAAAKRFSLHQRADSLRRRYNRTRARTALHHKGAARD